jgi:hypothetical protein
MSVQGSLQLRAALVRPALRDLVYLTRPGRVTGRDSADYSGKRHRDGHLKRSRGARKGAQRHTPQQGAVGFPSRARCAVRPQRVQSFALVEGDDRAALEAREAGLVIIPSNDQEPWTAHALVVPFDNVEAEGYHDPRLGLRWRGQPIPRRTSRLGRQARSTT